MFDLGTAIIGVTDTHIELKQVAIPLRDIVWVKRSWVNVRDLVVSAMVIWLTALATTLRTHAALTDAVLGTGILMSLTHVSAYALLEDQIGRGAGMVVVTMRDGARYRVWMGVSDFRRTRRRVAALYRKAHS